MRPTTRRGFLRSAGALAAATWLPGRHAATPGAAPAVLAQDGPVQQIRRAAARDPIQIQQLRGGVRVLIGSGGNVAALAGDDGVLLIDSGIVGPKVAAAVASFTPRPVRHVVNTHWHFDHTEANGWLHARGAAITAHANARKWLTADTRVEDWRFTFARSEPGALPATVIGGGHSMRLNGTDVVLTPYAPAHTDSDIAVHLADADVLHVADTWWNGIYPFIDYSTGGGIDGTIRASADNVARATASTVVIPGHGAVGGRADLVRFHDMLVAVRDRVASLKRQGRSEAEVVAAKPTAAFDRAWGEGGPIDGAFFARLVYKGV